MVRLGLVWPWFYSVARSLVVFTVSRSPMVRSAVSYSAVLSFGTVCSPGLHGSYGSLLHSDRAVGTQSPLLDRCAGSRSPLALGAARLQRSTMSPASGFCEPRRISYRQQVRLVTVPDRPRGLRFASPALRKQTSNSTVVWAASRRHWPPSNARLGRARSRTARHMTAGSA